jgi:tetratricopeptide (TPR) repeat protein
MKRWDNLIGKKGEGWERLLSGEGDFRIDLARNGLEIWKKAPWFGHGPASFDLEHLRWEAWKKGTRAVFTHNDYINTLCDYGAVGFFFVSLFWIYLVIFLWRRGKSCGKDSKADACTGLGWSVAGLMLIHALVDFNYHIPATAISSFLLLGIATAVVWPERATARRGLVHVVFIILTIGFAGVTAIRGWNTWAGWRSIPEKAAEAAKLSVETLEKMGQEMDRWDPRSPVLAETLGDVYRLKLIEVYFSPRETSPEAVQMRKEKLNGLAEAAILWYRKAEERSPKDDVYYVRRASVLDLQGKFSEAEVLYRMGMQKRPNGKFFAISYGNHLWRKGDLEGAKMEFEKAIALPGDVRSGSSAEKDSTAEAQEMLAQVKERIAKGGGVRQVKKFNPKED